MEVVNYQQFEAARRALQAARDATVRDERQALARCAERYLMGAHGYERATQAGEAIAPAVLGKTQRNFGGADGGA